MIKIQFGEIGEIVKGLGMVADTELPMDAGIFFKRLARKIRPEAEIFEDSRIDLVKKYGKKDDDGRLLMTDDQYLFSDRAAFNDAFRALEKKETEIDLDPLPRSTMGKDKMKAGIFIFLDKFIDEAK